MSQELPRLSQLEDRLAAELDLRSLQLEELEKKWKRLRWSVEATIKASEHGLRDLMYVISRGHPWDVRVSRTLAEKGDLEGLKYAHDNGCPWDEYTTAIAAEKGHLECLKYAHENGCPWDEKTTLYARRHLECLAYARDNGCPFVASAKFSGGKHVRHSHVVAAHTRRF